MFLSASFSLSLQLSIVVALSLLPACSSHDLSKEPTLFNKIFGNWFQAPKSEDEVSIQLPDLTQTHQLTPEDGKRQLAILVKMIDEDEDGYITKEELKTWIENKRHIYKDGNVEVQWYTFTSSNKMKLTWDEYKTIMYGYMADVDEEEREHVDKMLLWDRRRWNAVDTAGLDALSREQFAVFLYPEDEQHMHALLEVEEMEESDLDGDGRISLEEYLKGTFLAQNIIDEPDWVEHKRKHFLDHLDADNDGYMDAGKVYHWIVSGFDMAEVESNYLIFKADTDADQKLSTVEVVNSYTVFLKSHATEFGRALEIHEEF